MKNQYSKSSVPKSQVLYIERFKDELQKRGGRGIVGRFGYSVKHRYNRGGSGWPRFGNPPIVVPSADLQVCSF